MKRIGKTSVIASVSDFGTIPTNFSFFMPTNSRPEDPRAATFNKVDIITSHRRAGIGQ